VAEFIRPPLVQGLLVRSTSGRPTGANRARRSGAWPCKGQGTAPRRILIGAAGRPPPYRGAHRPCAHWAHDAGRHERCRGWLCHLPGGPQAVPSGGRYPV